MVMYRVRHVVSVMMLVLMMLCVQGVRPSAALQLCEQRIGSYYVNIAIKGSGFSRAFDDAFEVEIREVRPTKQEQITQLQNFSFYDPSKYTWEKEHNRYQLYKTEAGKPRQRVTVYAAQFPRSAQVRNELRLRKADPGKYNSYLKDRLDYLGVMGVVYQGRIPTLDFLNELDLAAGSSSPDVLVLNGDVALYRYGLLAGISGLDRDFSESDRKDPGAMHKLMQRFAEPRILWELPTLQSSSGQSYDPSEIIGEIGGINITNGLDADQIKPVYMPCLPEGMEEFGRPKAAFVPFKVQAGNSSFYPILVFPTAFSSLDTLNSAIRHEYYHARWWNAVAYLDADKSTEAGVLREALLRASPSFLERSILKETGGVSTTTGDVMSGMIEHQRQVLARQLNRAINTPGTEVSRFPWTIPIDLISPRRFGVDSSGGEGRTLRQVDRSYERLLSKHVISLKDFFNSNSGSMDTEKAQQPWVNLIVAGYHERAEDFDSRFNWALSDMKVVAGELTQYFKSITATESGNEQGGGTYDVDVSLFNTLRDSEFQFDDIEWLHALMASGRPLSGLASSTFGERIDFLVGQGVTYIEGLEQVWQVPGMVNLVVVESENDLAELRDQIDLLQEKVENVPWEVSSDNYMQLMLLDDEISFMREEIDKINSDIDDYAVNQLFKQAEVENDLADYQVVYDTMENLTANIEEAREIMEQQKQALANLSEEEKNKHAELMALREELANKVLANDLKAKALGEAASGLVKLKTEAINLLNNGENLAIQLSELLGKLKDRQENQPQVLAVDEDALAQHTEEAFNKLFDDLAPVLADGEAFYNGIFREAAQQNGVRAMAKTILYVKRAAKKVAVASAQTAIATTVPAITALSPVVDAVWGLIESSSYFSESVEVASDVVATCEEESDCVARAQQALDQLSQEKAGADDCNSFPDPEVCSDAGDRLKENLEKKKVRRQSSRKQKEFERTAAKIGALTLGAPPVVALSLQTKFNKIVELKEKFESGKLVKEDFRNLHTDQIKKKLCQPVISAYEELHNYFISVVDSTSEQTGGPNQYSMVDAAVWSLASAEECNTNAETFVALRKVAKGLKDIEDIKKTSQDNSQRKVNKRIKAIKDKLATLLNNSEKKAQKAKSKKLKNNKAEEKELKEQEEKLKRELDELVDIKNLAQEEFDKGTSKANELFSQYTDLDSQMAWTAYYIGSQELEDIESERLALIQNLDDHEAALRYVNTDVSNSDWARFSLNQFFIFDHSGNTEALTALQERFTKLPNPVRLMSLDSSLPEGSVP